MGNLAWIAALGLMAASPQQAQQSNPTPAHQASPPNERAADIPASASKYSAFGAPDATAPDAGTETKTTTTARTKTMKTHHRVLCADGTSPKTAAECKDHGGAAK